jgi:hypothetical protein
MTDSVINIDEPKTTREMFQFIMRDIGDLKSGMAEFNSLKVRVTTVEKCQGVQEESISTLKTRVNGWNVINSLGVIIASILAALGLKSS